MKIRKKINGILVDFEITYQPKYKADKEDRYFQKIIDVSVEDGGWGPAACWADAIEYARELTQ